MLLLQSAITVSLKDMAWKHTEYSIQSNPSHTRLKQQWEKYENNFRLSIQKHWREAEEEIERQLQSVLRSTQT